MPVLWISSKWHIPISEWASLKNSLNQPLKLTRSTDVKTDWFGQSVVTNGKRTNIPWQCPFKSFHLSFVFILFSYIFPRHQVSSPMTMRLLSHGPWNAMSKLCTLSRKVFSLLLPIASYYHFSLSSSTGNVCGCRSWQITFRQAHADLLPILFYVSCLCQILPWVCGVF